MSASDDLKLFGITNQLIEHDLDQVEQRLGIDLGRTHKSVAASQESAYYAQIETAIRAEAASMAPHYEVFYSLEKTIRSIVSETIGATDGDGWWSAGRVPEPTKTECEKRLRREIETGVTPRSDDLLDFATFGELSVIITSNWDIFGTLFRNQKALERVMANLNTLRGPIAHCSALAEDEVVRLNLSVRDWFRLME